MQVNVIFDGKIISKAKIFSGLSKFKGLMFSRRLKKGNSIILKGKNLRVHMLFVFFPLDLVFLDENKKVIDIRIGRLFELYIKPIKKASYVIEMNYGENRLKTGNIVGFKDVQPY